MSILHAACRHPETGEVVTGNTHCEAWLRMFPAWDVEEIAAYVDFDKNPALEGFVTNEGRFVSRQEALLIALAAKQANIRGGLWQDDHGEPVLIAEATAYRAA